MATGWPEVPIYSPTHSIQISGSWRSCKAQQLRFGKRGLRIMRAKVAIAGLLLALVGGGIYQYSQRGMKLSETDTILIGDFTNSTGDPTFDGSLKEALAISLGQSPLLNLLSVEK